jgi:hypothetical protein
MKKSLLLVCLFTAWALVGCSHSAAPFAVSAASTPPAIGSAAVSSSGAPLLPNPHLSPGATLDVTVQDIAVPGYAHKVRNVPVSVKRAVYAEYGISHHRPGEFEVDHLISLELGGSNSIKNLWPQSYVTQPWNAHVKDQLENKLHDLVCSGQVPLATAQQEIAVNWIAAYQKYFHTQMPLAHGYRGHRREDRLAPDSSTPMAGNGVPDPVIGTSSAVALPSGTAGSSDAGQVWVNTRSGKYFRAGSRYYGHTKEGQYMTEAQAEKQGYAAAKSR